MSRRAIEEGAINIGQGFPDYPIDPRLAPRSSRPSRRATTSMRPMEGVIRAARGVAAKLQTSYGIGVDPLSEITVTCGATEALYDAIQAVLGPGDEAIIFDPAYDAYEPAVRLAGGRCVRIPLEPPRFEFDWDEFGGVSHRAPASSSSTVRKIRAARSRARADLEALAALVRDRPISILADEVYENVVFDGRRHASVLAHPELRERSFAVFSFGKALHATGWRTGYCVAPPLAHPRAAQSASVQHLQHRRAARNMPLRAILPAVPTCGTDCRPFFQRKRDLLADLLKDSGFEVLRSAGTYFLLVDYRALSRASDLEFSDRLIREAKVATIPLSPFYAEPPPMTLLRLCIAKKDETLAAAAERLRSFASA